MKITIDDIMISAVIITAMYFFINWSERKKKKDEKKYRLDEHERKIS